MSAMIGAPLLLGDDGYNISRSVRLRSSASAFFNRTPGSAGNRQTWTWSGWVKRGGLSSTQIFFSANTNAGSDTDHTDIRFTSSDTLLVFNDASGTGTVNLNTTQVFRDPSAWYHIVVAVDTTQATASNRIKIYVNGAQITAFATSTYPSQNVNLFVNNNINHRIGNYQPVNLPFDGYLTEINFIDGQALTPSSFGETDVITGVWKPKKYLGTYGTNGFYLNFSDPSAATAAAIGKDYSGNGNNWTPNNISVTSGVTYDSMLDVPTLWADGGNGRGNYAVMNPLYKPSNQSSMSFRNANMEVGQAATNAVSSVAGTFSMSSGKWYWEVTVGGSFNHSALGIQTDINTAWRGSGTVLYRSDGQKVIGGGTPSSYGSSFTTNDVLGFAYDADAGTLTCYKNNTSQGVIYSSGSGNVWLACAHDDNAGAGVTYYHAFNFGQRPFAYTPPSGFRALNTGNLPEPTIKKGNQFFNAVTFDTQSGSYPKSITGTGFQPDLVWAKSRNQAYPHYLFDAVRGTGIKSLSSNSTAAEGDGTTNLSSFDANGFTVSAGDGIGFTSGVAWQWKEGATQGFDIVTYTGNGAAQTVAHSLGVAPRMIIAKRRNGAQNWFVGHSSFASWASAIEGLNTTAAVNNGATAVFNSTAPTSSVFTVGTDLSASGGTYVAYLFSEVAGFSRFGSYTGNGSTDGPFVFTGFRPRWIMIKNIQDNTTSWSMWDTSRSPSNLGDQRLEANASAAESSLAQFDLLSNGFKLRSSNSNNASGQTIIFAAFAEVPFRVALAR